MVNKTTAIAFSILACTWTLLTACSTQPDAQTLRSLDIRGHTRTQGEVFVKPKSEADVRAAYYAYIQSAQSGDSSRLLAISRLAEMEMDRFNRLLREDDEAELDDEVYRESLERTRNLLQASLDEFPDAPSNHETLYQLARTHLQLGDSDGSLAALRELSRRYPESPHYAEAQFRLGEAAFIMGDYLAAEDAYSEALFNDPTRTFYERALFKRGWSRYKQGLFIEAADDYLAALKNRSLENYDQLDSREKDELDEYFRAIGLAFANLQDLDVLQNFFVHDSDRKYLYHVYRVISETYLEQERYSDAAGVLARFVDLNPGSCDVPLARLKVVDVWRSGGFRSLFAETVEDFYNSYHPDHSYWINRSGATRDAVANSLRSYGLQLASYHHERYLKSENITEFRKAKLWYQRYLQHFSPYAQQDRVYTSYAELLAHRGENEKALRYFELAAYDGDIILDKDAAYATIVLADKLRQQHGDAPQWLNKQLRYALISARLYPNEATYQAAALHAAESAFVSGRYEEAVALVEVIPDRAANRTLYQSEVLKGLAYRESGRFEDAEAVFAELLEQGLDSRERKEQQDNLALSIFRQAERALAEGNTNVALQHFSRIADLTPDSPIAPTALYEAVALSMANEQWHNAIRYAESFQQRYPGHKLGKDATRQASAAYLKAGDKAKAARAFEQLAAQDGDREVKMAALWQAAEIYESRNELESAIRSYRTYAHTYTTPYPQFVEAMYRLTQLYGKTGETDKRQFWQEKIGNADRKTPKSRKTDRTNQLVASTLLELAARKAEEFRRRKLVAPLAVNLRMKKRLLQESTGLYGRASAFGLPDVTTEATYAIARIYQDFSRALLESERPPELRGEELLQYNILLEDQAFPFEEKAIEFYETNLARTRIGTRSRWIVESYKQLVTLFPARYDRKGKVGVYRDENL